MDYNLLSVLLISHFFLKVTYIFITFSLEKPTIGNLEVIRDEIWRIFNILRISIGKSLHRGFSNGKKSQRTKVLSLKNMSLEISVDHRSFRPESHPKMFNHSFINQIKCISLKLLDIHRFMNKMCAICFHLPKNYTIKKLSPVTTHIYLKKNQPVISILPTFWIHRIFLVLSNVRVFW